MTEIKVWSGNHTITYSQHVRKKRWDFLPVCNERFCADINTTCVSTCRYLWLPVCRLNAGRFRRLTDNRPFHKTLEAVTKTPFGHLDVICESTEAERGLKPTRQVYKLPTCERERGLRWCDEGKTDNLCNQPPAGLKMSNICVWREVWHIYVLNTTSTPPSYASCLF